MAINLQEIKELKAVAGIKIGITQAAIKRANRDDLTLMQIDKNSSIAGVFTQNAFCAAPVLLCRENLQNDIQALIINTGNANAGTGQKGLDDARTICSEVAKQLNIKENQILPFSTGVIGEFLPIDKIINNIPNAINNLSEHNFARAAKAIMTTDTIAKGFSKSIHINDEEIVITGISKGAGMIKPNMATMLGFVATNARVEKSLLQEMLKEIVDVSFNRITIDGDTSTNDSCLLIATNKTKFTLQTKNDDYYQEFKEALQEVFIHLATSIVRDGEGATKFVAIEVINAKTNAEACEVGFTIAHSPLIKTALFASDPNFGRIMAAIGRSNIENLDIQKVSFTINDLLFVENGMRAETYTEEQGAKIMQDSELTIKINLNRGSCKQTVWSTDLSYDYVKINAEYRT